MSAADLRKLTDELLIEGLSPSIRRMIDGLLEQGMPPFDLLEHVRKAARQSREGGTLTYAAVEAYVEQRLATRPRYSLYMRWIISRDLPEIVATETASFPMPWDEEAIRAPLRQHGCIGMAAERYIVGTPSFEAPVVGHILYRLKARCIGVFRLAVHPAHRRNGVATYMHCKIMGRLSEHRRDRITLSAPDWALGCHCLLRKLGFLAVGVQRGAGEDGGDLYRFGFHKPTN